MSVAQDKRAPRERKLQEENNGWALQKSAECEEGVYDHKCWGMRVLSILPQAVYTPLEVMWLQPFWYSVTCTARFSTPSRLPLQYKVVGASGRQPPYYCLCWVCFSSASIFKFVLKLFHWYFCKLYSKPKFKILPIKFHRSIHHVNSLASHHVSSSEKGLSKMILYASKYLRPWPASHHPQNLRECCLHSHTINVSWTNQQIRNKNKPATRSKIWERRHSKPPSSMVLNPRCILESPGSLYTAPIPRSALIRISGTGTILKFFKWCWCKTRDENHCSRWVLSHRPFCNDGSGLPLCCPIIQQSLVTCGYWALEMQPE